MKYDFDLYDLMEVINESPLEDIEMNVEEFLDENEYSHEPECDDSVDYKVGDKVTLKDDFMKIPGCKSDFECAKYQLEFGETYTVERFDGDWVDLKEPNNCYINTQFKKIEEKVEFRVGDIIIGTNESDDEYSFTTSKAIMKVVGIEDDGEINVEIKSHTKYDNYIGADFIVESKYFKLV